MPCAFHAERPAPFAHLPAGCQFSVSEEELVSDRHGRRWCPFHLPESEKSGWESDRLKAFQEAIDRYIREPRERGAVLDCSGVVFPEEVRFQRLELPAVCLYKTRFLANADFTETRFLGDVLVKETAFSKEACFRGSRFSGSVECDNTIFKDKIDCTNVHVRGRVDFYDGTFALDALFEEARFDGAINCRRLTFNGAAIFCKSVFSGTAIFACAFDGAATFCKSEFRDTVTFQCEFRGGADFSEATFSDVLFLSSISRVANCSKAAFQGNVSFGKVELGSFVFSGEAYFEEANFEQDARFAFCQFEGDAFFHDAVFKGKADFRSSYLTYRFSKLADFQGTRFHSDADFEGRRFAGTVIFDRTHFHGEANFRETAFMTDLLVREAIFEGAADFQCNELKKDAVIARADFTGTTFGDKVSFQNRYFPQPAHFGDCVFSKAPEFHGASLHQGTVFPPRTHFKDTESRHAPAAYRTLKLAMEQHRARQEEGMFFALEQESRRKQPETPRSVKAMARLYKTGADYGESFVRPFLGIICVTAVAWAIYLVGTFVEIGDWRFLDAFRFAIEQAVRPFSVWTPGGGAAIRRLFETDTYTFVILQIAATFQSLLTLGLLTLFILAVRRRFKLD